MTPVSAIVNASGVYRPERGMLAGEHLGDVGRRELLAPHRPPTAPSASTAIGMRAGQLLRGGNRLPARAIERAVALFGDDENHRTLASSRSRRTSSFAASAGEPPIICVCLLRVGSASATICCAGCRPGGQRRPS